MRELGTPPAFRAVWGAPDRRWAALVPPLPPSGPGRGRWTIECQGRGCLVLARLRCRGGGGGGGRPVGMRSEEGAGGPGAALSARGPSWREKLSAPEAQFRRESPRRESALAPAPSFSESGAGKPREEKRTALSKVGVGPHNSPVGRLGLRTADLGGVRC